MSRLESHPNEPRKPTAPVPFTLADAPDWLRPLADLGGNDVAWVDLPSLPPVVVGDRCLHSDHLRGLLAVLRSFPDAKPKVCRHADLSTLDAFACRLLDLWLAHGAPPGEKWVLQAVGVLGGDSCALKLGPLIRSWPGEGHQQRAALGLECLRAIGTDTALTQLSGIAQKVKYKALQNRAREFMASVAKARGLTAEELEDRIVPDLGLDEKGGRTFDFGPRKFILALDAELNPVPRDESGALRDDLPKPNAKDDAEKAAAAVADWRLLKKQLREALKVQVVRLEQAMVCSRLWPAKDFVALVARHPLMTHLARRLLWLRFTEGGNPISCFRVNEESALVDAENGPVHLADEERVALVHPLHLEAGEKARWSQVFADYELLPPFPQLSRPIHALTPEEEQGPLITRHADVTIPELSVIGTLEGRGWRHGTPEDAGCYDNFSKPFGPANVTAVIALDPGIAIGLRGGPDQKVSGCLFIAGLEPPRGYVTNRHQEGRPPTPDKPMLVLAQVDPVVRSEVLGDLEALAGKGRN
jgi:hypothetical protein